MNDTVKESYDRIVPPFVNYIEGHLTEIGTQMRYDEDREFMINVNGGVAQINIANDNATVHGTQSNDIDVSQPENIISDIMKYIPTDTIQEEREQISDGVEAIRAEVQGASPRKGFTKTAPKGLQAINGTAQLGSAIATLVQFPGVVL